MTLPMIQEARPDSFLFFCLLYVVYLKTAEALFLAH